ncbi:cupin domain-containing protein [Micromonospora pisi]|uniref:cupin domain-containing protein n=1 Tax=Micromonospora pisi TaxID=589240 RepID=UPI0011C3CA03|nr:cupin domain-containing protein [Micromonospora pisi]
MEILSFDVSAGQPAEAYGSVGVTAQALFRGEAVAVTVLHVAAGGEVGRHPAPVDQLLVITAGHGVVQAGSGDWENVGAGQAVVWLAGEEHTTRAVADITAVVIEMAAAL